MSKAVLAGRAVCDLMFPRRCPFCGDVLGYLPRCPECEKSVKALERPVYRLSGGEHRLENLESTAALYRYKDEVRQAVLMMKFHRQPWYGRELGFAMAEGLFGCVFSARRGIITMKQPEKPALMYDLVISVPSTRKKRGYNSTAIMGSTLAEALELPFLKDGLVRVRQTVPQATLGEAERLVNQIGSMEAARPDLVEGKRILLVDDIVTTGATISEAARALMKAGADSVYGFAAAAREWEGPERREERQPEKARREDKDI